jgi:pimeloyl-ACP methyl ester carboxylesterase
MRAGARAMPDTMVRRVARTAAGRAALTGTIYARPGRRSPEAVLAETRALRNAAGFTGVLAAEPGGLGVFEHDVTGIPVTVAWGDKDRLLLPRQGVRAKKTIPGARLVRLRGCGHVPMNDDPAMVARVITDTTAQA